VAQDALSAAWERSRWGGTALREKGEGGTVIPAIGKASSFLWLGLGGCAHTRLARFSNVPNPMTSAHLSSFMISTEINYCAQARMW
jgi:hypothetical protein